MPILSPLPSPSQASLIEIPGLITVAIYPVQLIPGHGLEVHIASTNLPTVLLDLMKATYIGMMKTKGIRMVIVQLHLEQHHQMIAPFLVIQTPSSITVAVAMAPYTHQWLCPLVNHSSCTSIAVRVVSRWLA